MRGCRMITAATSAERDSHISSNSFELASEAIEVDLNDRVNGVGVESLNDNGRRRGKRTIDIGPPW